MTKTPQQKWNKNNPEKMAAINQQVAAKCIRINLRLYSDRPSDAALLEWLEGQKQEGEALAGVVRRLLEVIAVKKEVEAGD